VALFVTIAVISAFIRGRFPLSRSRFSPRQKGDESVILLKALKALSHPFPSNPQDMPGVDCERFL
jgi:hypothetical protein